MLNLIDLTVGQRLKLRDGAVGEIVDNIGDGIWVVLRFDEGTANGRDTTEGELVHCEEVVGLANADG